MLQIIVLVSILALVFAVKVFAVIKTHEEIVANSTSFSWMRARSYDEIIASARATEAELSVLAQERSVAETPRTVRQVGRVGV